MAEEHTHATGGHVSSVHSEEIGQEGRDESDEIKGIDTLSAVSGCVWTCTRRPSVNVTVVFGPNRFLVPRLR